MEKLITPRFELVKRVRKIKIESFFKVGLFSFKRQQKYLMPDSSYGEWIFTINGIPKFYFVSYSIDGSLNAISKYIEEQNLEYEPF